jgi:hypothetical protein
MLAYIIAENTYPANILNRFRLQRGLPAIECYDREANVFKASDQLLPDAYPRLLRFNGGNQSKSRQVIQSVPPYEHDEATSASNDLLSSALF